jgi:uncharacterized membrane protein YdjX (TVP38/TMEM64 family)
MNIETLLVLLVLAAIVTLLVRAVSGIHLVGCLVSYVLACLGAVGGWIVQQRYFAPDQLLAVPWNGRQITVSVLGAAIGALLVSFLGRGIGQPLRSPARRRRRRY